MFVRAYLTSDIFGGGSFEIVDAVATPSHLIIVTRGVSLGNGDVSLRKVSKRRMLEKEQEKSNVHDFPIPGEMTNNKMSIAVFDINSLTLEAKNLQPLLLRQFEV